MSKISPSNSPCSEEQLVALLATLRVEPVKEADFEGRFLCEFHERVAREAVCCPARRHLLAHLMQMLSNFGRGRLAFGASTLCLGVVAVGYAMYPAGQAGVGTAAATVAVDRNAAPLLIPWGLHTAGYSSLLKNAPGCSAYHRTASSRTG